jgi:hypothetical protein
MTKDAWIEQCGSRADASSVLEMEHDGERSTPMSDNGGYFGHFVSFMIPRILET